MQLGTEEHGLMDSRPARLRVLTLNLWGQQGNWVERRAVLRAGLATLQPDLVAFHETIVRADYDQARDLLGPEYSVVHQARRAADGQAATIASRWPLVASHELDLHVTHRTADFVATSLVAEIHLPTPMGPLLFVNHFPNWQLNFEHERELQALVAARFIESLTNQRQLHVVLVGDLDADPDAGSVRFWSGRQALQGLSVCYRDAWESMNPHEPGHTYTPRNPLMNDWDWPFRRIDYIFVRCGKHGGPTLAIASCALIFDKPLDGVRNVSMGSGHRLSEISVPRRCRTSLSDRVRAG